MKFDEQDVLYQQVLVRDPSGRIIHGFYICRLIGSRECWIDAKVLSPAAQALAFATPFAWREAEITKGEIIRIVSVEWLLEQPGADQHSRQWLEGISTALDRDNSKGQLKGQIIYRNP